MHKNEKLIEPVRRAGSPNIPLAGPLCLFLLGAALSTLASYDPSLGALWLLWLGAGSALYILIVWIVRSEARLLLAAHTLVVAATLAAFGLMTQYSHLGFEDKFSTITWLGRSISAPFPALNGLYLQQNAAAAVLEGVLPLALGTASASRGWRRLTWCGCAFTIALGVLLTGSRGAWLALAATAPLGILAALRASRARCGVRIRLRAIPLFALCMAVGLALFVMPHWQQFRQAIGFRTLDRLALYRNSLFLALEFPFSGIGAGATFGGMYSHFQLLIPVFYLGYAHNLFLAIWLAQGLLGLVGFGGLLLASSRLIWCGLYHAAGEPSSRVGWGAALGCAAVLFHGVSDAPQYSDAWYALLMIFVVFGLMVAAASLTNARPLSWTHSKGTRWAILAPLLVTLAITWRPLLALGSANIAAVLHAHSALSPNLSSQTRAALRQTAIGWADYGLGLHASTTAVYKERGMLAFSAPDNDYGLAAHMLELAFQEAPADQSIRKALGYAYVWQGQVSKGVQILRGIDRVDEIAGELQVWPTAWRDRGRADLAERAERAAAIWYLTGAPAAHNF